MKKEADGKPGRQAGVGGWSSGVTSAGISEPPRRAQLQGTQTNEFLFQKPSSFNHKHSPTRSRSLFRQLPAPGCFGRSQLTARSLSPECQVQFRVRPFQQPQRCAWKNRSRCTWHIYNFSDFPQGTRVNIFRSGGDVRKFIVKDLELTILTWFPSYSLELMENMGYQPNLLKQGHA